MPGPLHFVPLGSSDAPLIGALQRRLFPPALCETDAYIAQILRNTERHTVCNFSYGLFDGAHLAGYVFAYIETDSVFHQRKEEVVYIKEIALLPGHEDQMRPLLARLLMQWRTFTPQLSFEAHALADSLARWRRLARLFRFHGLSFAARQEPPRPGRPPYWLMRLDRVSETAQQLDHPAPLPAVRIACGDGVEACVLTSARQWLGLRDDWERLRQASGSQGHLPFDYLWQWWQHFGIWRDLHVIVLLRGPRVVGIAPLMREYLRQPRQVMRPPRPVLRRLRPLASAGLAWNPPALLAEDLSACGAALIACLSAGAKEWDLLDLPGQRDVAMMKSLQAGALNTGWLIACAPQRIACEEPGVPIHPANADPAATSSLRIRRIDSWPELGSGLDVQCEIEEEGGYPGVDVPLGDDREMEHFLRRLARPGHHGVRCVQHLAEQHDESLASRIGMIHGTDFLLLRAADTGTAEAALAAQALQEAERVFLLQQGVHRLMYLDGDPRGTATTHADALRLQVWQPRHRRAFLRQSWRERAARLLDAMAIGGFGRGMARRLRGP